MMDDIVRGGTEVDADVVHRDLVGRDDDVRGEPPVPEVNAAVVVRNVIGSDDDVHGVSGLNADGIVPHVVVVENNVRGEAREVTGEKEDAAGVVRDLVVADGNVRGGNP